MAISTDDRAASYSEWREHWLIPVVSLIALMVTFSHIYTIGLFFAPLEKAFGWSRAIVASGLTIVSIISVMLAPAIGILIDRYGSRRLDSLKIVSGFRMFPRTACTRSGVRRFDLEVLD